MCGAEPPPLQETMNFINTHDAERMLKLCMFKSMKRTLKSIIIFEIQMKLSGLNTPIFQMDFIVYSCLYLTMFILTLPHFMVHLNFLFFKVPGLPSVCISLPTLEGFWKWNFEMPFPLKICTRLKLIRSKQFSVDVVLLLEPQIKTLLLQYNPKIVHFW